MVNEEHLRYMIKMAEFDKHDGKDCRPMTQYSRHDYVSMQMLHSLITGTISYALLWGIYAIYRLDDLLEKFNTMEIRTLLINSVVGYLAFLLVYEIVTYSVAQKRYTVGRKKVKHYYNSIRKMNQIYEREERIKMPATDGKNNELWR